MGDKNLCIQKRRKKIILPCGKEMAERQKKINFSMSAFVKVEDTK